MARVLRMEQVMLPVFVSIGANHNRFSRSSNLMEDPNRFITGLDVVLAQVAHTVKLFA